MALNCGFRSIAVKMSQRGYKTTVRSINHMSSNSGEFHHVIFANDD